MDTFLEWIAKNREWLFSGTGVVAVTFMAKVAWSRFRPVEPIAQSALLPPVQTTEPSEAVPTSPPATNYSVVEMKRAYIVKRVDVGDYIDIANGSSRNIRISVKGLDELDVPVGVLNQTRREDVVALSVDLGGGIASCGTSVKRTDVNEFLIPKLNANEALGSVFSFTNTKDYTSMIRIGVEHINRQTKTVDMNIVHVVGLFQ